jgi:hypothetical protein
VLPGIWDTSKTNGGEFCFQTREKEREIEKKGLSMIFFVFCTGDPGNEGREGERERGGKRERVPSIT